MVIRCASLALLSSALWAQSPGIAGTWAGTLNAGVVQLRLGLHISGDTKTGFVSTLDSIDQNAMGIPVATTTFSAGKLHLDLPDLGATYDATLNQEGTAFAGTFTQGGAPLPLTFKRVEKIAALHRPQNPKPPFPYRPSTSVTKAVHFIWRAP